MLKSFVIMSFLSSAVWAQSTVSFPPSGISDSCSTFLKAFNEDKSLGPCTSAIISATSAFTAPGNKASKSAITSALDTIASSDACSESTIRSKLTEFYAACTAELTSKQNQEVITLYDVVYATVPFKKALVTKDDDGTYCVFKTASGDSVGDLQKYLVVQDGGEGSTSMTPNATSFQNSGLLFLNLKEDMPPESLCTPCTRDVLTSYITWASNINYAPGLSSSQLLTGQSKLYSGVQNTCGQNFLSGAVQAAGGLSSGSIFGGHNGALPSGAMVGGTITAIMGSIVATILALL